MTEFEAEGVYMLAVGVCVALLGFRVISMNSKDPEATELWVSKNAGTLDAMKFVGISMAICGLLKLLGVL